LLSFLDHTHARAYAHTHKHTVGFHRENNQCIADATAYTAHNKRDKYLYIQWDSTPPSLQSMAADLRLTPHGQREGLYNANSTMQTGHFTACLLAQCTIAKSFVMPARPPVRPSVRPYRASRLQLDGCSWNLVFEYFSKLFRENSNLIKT
jgi:hypothetical protein